MRTRCARLLAAVLVAGWLCPLYAIATPYEQRSLLARSFYTSIAVVANVLPGLSAVYAPQCLPGYIVCKVAFAGISLVAAGDQFFLSGGEDVETPRALLHRGFGGDWVLTGRHTSGDSTPQPLPEAPPPPRSSDAWEPPPR